MGTYKLFGNNVQIQYKSCLFSKAMFFTCLLTILTITLPFLIAYRSRGFWLKSHSFFEQPKVHFTYEYLLLVETDDPSRPIICGEAVILGDDTSTFNEICGETQVQEYDYNNDGIKDVLNFKFRITPVSPSVTITSILLVLGVDYQLKTVCPLRMQSLAIITKEFSVPPSEFSYVGDLKLYQTQHLPCMWNILDDRFNSSLLGTPIDETMTIIDYVLNQYFRRSVISRTEKMISRSQNGNTGSLNIKINLNIPESKVVYTPSIMQELKWAWPQYLSLLVVFYWIFERIKSFVFNHRLLMAWEIVPWTK